MSVTIDGRKADGGAASLLGVWDAGQQAPFGDDVGQPTARTDHYAYGDGTTAWLMGQVPGKKDPRLMELLALA
jgi:hypothetical protein